MTAVEVDGESEPMVGGGVTSTQTLEQPGRQNNTFFRQNHYLFKFNSYLCTYCTGSGWPPFVQNTAMYFLKPWKANNRTFVSAQM